MLLAVGGLTGCSVRPVQWVTPEAGPSASESADSAVAVDPQFLVQSLDGDTKALDEGSPVGLRIATPFFDGTLEELFVGKRLGARTAGQVRRDTGLAAPEGYDLIAFTMRAGAAANAATAESAPTFTLRLGDRGVPVESPFGRTLQSGSPERGWAMFIVCVPEGDLAHLDVADQGKTCTVDLRTGLPTENADWAATAGFRQRIDAAVDPVEATFSARLETVPPPDFEKESAELSLTMRPDVRTSPLSPWHPVLGWAAAGEQWLVLPMNAKVAFAPDRPQFVLDIDVPRAFSYEDEFGAARSARLPERVSTMDIAQDVPLDVVWGVSGNDSNAVARFIPNGELTVNYQGTIGVDTLPAVFVGTPQPLEFSLTFTPQQQ